MISRDFPRFPGILLSSWFPPRFYSAVVKPTRHGKAAQRWVGTGPWQARPCGQPGKEKEAEGRKQGKEDRREKAEESKGEGRRRVAAEGKQEKACPTKAYLRALIINAGLY